MVENTAQDNQQDLADRISIEWANMVSNQKEAAQFIEGSQRKALDGLGLFAFFNKKLVSDPFTRVLIAVFAYRTSIDSSSMKVKATRQDVSRQLKSKFGSFFLPCRSADSDEQKHDVG